jgi:glycosyltransferase involved in cell wall biosynthesis
LAQIVYDYEYWRGAEESTRARIENALSLTAVSHIATSTVVRLMLDEFGTTVVATVPPGIDTTRYRVITPPEDRRLVIGFANRGEDFKGINDVLPVLGQLKEAYPAIRVSCFGDNGVHSLPAWVDDRHHLSDAELVDFYNRCAIFVLPSHYEGFGLTAAEAMACGAAVVVTDCGGPAEFAEHGRTALVVQPRDQSALREAIALLAEDATLRSRLARAGAAHAATMGWPPRADALEQVLASIAQPSTSTASRPQVE